jgi:hypothetical protein
MGGGPTPGTYTVASRTLAQNFSDEELIYTQLFANKANKCVEGPYRELERGPYSLKMQEWRACGINDITSLVVAAAPTGSLTGNKDKKAEGRADQDKGTLKKKKGAVKDLLK